MKKLMVLVALLGLIGSAQADNVWNIKWYITGAWSPDDSSKGVLEDYNVTWSLINATDNETIDSMSALKGSSEIFVTDPFNGEVLYYNSKLKPDDSSAYIGTTTLSGVKSVYQYIFIDNGVDQYEWTSSPVEITLSSSTLSPPTPISEEVRLGQTTDWTKVSGGSTVPEPATMSLLGLGALAMVLRRKLSK